MVVDHNPAGARRCSASKLNPKPQTAKSSNPKPGRRPQVQYSLTAEGTQGEPNPQSLLGLDSDNYYRCARAASGVQD